MDLHVHKAVSMDFTVDSQLHKLISTSDKPLHITTKSRWLLWSNYFHFLPFTGANNQPLTAFQLVTLSLASTWVPVREWWTYTYFVDS